MGEDYGPRVVVSAGGPEEGPANDGDDLGHVYLRGGEGVLIFRSVVIGQIVNY